MKNRYIKSNEEYLGLFNDEPVPDSTQVSKALQVALDTRKFEIELYWKRATYFWAFIAASITAFFVLLTSNNINNFKHFTIIISLTGYLFSLGWFLVNRGSKYWQENWERHVSNLERQVLGPLFAHTKIPEKYHFWNPTKGFPFSVSKVNQLLSLFMTIFWFGLFIYSLLFCYDKVEAVKEWMTIESTNWIFAIWLIIITAISIIIILISRSFVIKDIDSLTKVERRNWLFMEKNSLKKEQ